jgi:hypothetical protein
VGVFGPAIGVDSGGKFGGALRQWMVGGIHLERLVGKIPRVGIEGQADGFYPMRLSALSAAGVSRGFESHHAPIWAIKYYLFHLEPVTQRWRAAFGVVQDIFAFSARTAGHQIRSFCQRVSAKIEIPHGCAINFSVWQVLARMEILNGSANFCRRRGRPDFFSASQRSQKQISLYRARVGDFGLGGASGEDQQAEKRDELVHGNRIRESGLAANRN